MKVLLIIVTLFLASTYNRCQTTEALELEQMEKIIKAPPVEKRRNYFERFKKKDKVLYYVQQPTAQKIEAIKEDIAIINADYDVKIIRVRHISEATLVIK